MPRFDASSTAAFASHGRFTGSPLLDANSTWKESRFHCNWRRHHNGSIGLNRVKSMPQGRTRTLAASTARGKALNRRLATTIIPSAPFAAFFEHHTPYREISLLAHPDRFSPNKSEP